MSAPGASSDTRSPKLALSLSFFWLHRMAHGILVPQPRTEPAPSAMKARSLTHWTTKEFPKAPKFFTRGRIPGWRDHRPDLLPKKGSEQQFSNALFIK